MSTPDDALLWLARLEQARRARVRTARHYRTYVDGSRSVLSLAPQKFREAMRNLINVSDTWGSVVVSAPAERLEVVGFRFPNDATGDKKAWALWQENSLDADQGLLFHEALATGTGFMLVWPNPVRAWLPEITVEDPDACQVAYAPGSRRRRAAGMKLWQDELGYAYATVYLPDAVYKFRSKTPNANPALPAMRGTAVDSRDWEPRLVDGEPWPLPNPLLSVPLVELQNNPDLRGSAHSELEPVTSLIDAASKTLGDALIAAEYSAYRQRHVTGIELAIDEDGNPIEPFKAAIDRLWVAPDKDVKFGEFGQTDLVPYTRLLQELVGHIAAQTRLPMHLFLTNASGQVPSGEALQAAEAGLVRRVEQRQRTFGESLEEVIRLAFLASGDSRRSNVTALETIWADAQTFSEALRTDAVVKRASLGVIPAQQLLEDLGIYSPQQIDRMLAQPAPTPDNTGTPQ